MIPEVGANWQQELRREGKQASQDLIGTLHTPCLVLFEAPGVRPSADELHRMGEQVADVTRLKGKPKYFMGILHAIEMRPAGPKALQRFAYIESGTALGPLPAILANRHSRMFIQFFEGPQNMIHDPTNDDPNLWLAPQENPMQELLRRTELQMRGQAVPVYQPKRRLYPLLFSNFKSGARYTVSDLEAKEQAPVGPQSHEPRTSQGAPMRVTYREGGRDVVVNQATYKIKAPSADGTNLGMHKLMDYGSGRGIQSYVRAVLDPALGDPRQFINNLQYLCQTSQTQYLQNLDRYKSMLGLYERNQVPTFNPSRVQPSLTFNQNVPVFMGQPPNIDFSQLTPAYREIVLRNTMLNRIQGGGDVAAVFNPAAPGGERELNRQKAAKISHVLSSRKTQQNILNRLALNQLTDQELIQMGIPI